MHAVDGEDLYSAVIPHFFTKQTLLFNLTDVMHDSYETLDISEHRRLSVPLILYLNLRCYLVVFYTFFIHYIVHIQIVHI